MVHQCFCGAYYIQILHKMAVLERDMGVKFSQSTSTCLMSCLYHGIIGAISWNTVFHFI